MSDEVNKAKEMAKEQDIHMSTVRKERKSLRYLQRMKDKGEKIVQMCPAELGPMFGMAAEMAGCDIMRVTDISAQFPAGRPMQPDMQDWVRLQKMLSGFSNGATNIRKMVWEA